MAYTTLFTNGHIPNQVQTFAVDTVEDMNAIDVSQLLPGSKTFVMYDGEDQKGQWYMLTVKERKWKKVDLGRSGGSGGGGSEDYDHIIYDGGSEDGDQQREHVFYDGGSEDG